MDRHLDFMPAAAALTSHCTIHRFVWWERLPVSLSVRGLVEAINFFGKTIRS